MLATLAQKPFDDKDWVFEIKWDGYRAIAEVGNSLRLYSRNGLSFADKFYPIAHALQSQKQQMILDGEIVAYNEKGDVSFQALQHFAESPGTSIIYHVFDLLSLHGHNTESLSLLQRKELLKEALIENDYIKYCDHVAVEGNAFFDAVKKNNLEGMIAKFVHSEYTEGRRSGHWLKIKWHNTEEVIIAGYTAPQGSRSKFGALILGRYQNGELVYAGHTGTGFNEKTLSEVYHLLQPLVVKKSPFKTIPKTNMPATWVKPQLVCEIKFSELTKENIFRHPVFMGIREDKAAREVTVSTDKNILTMKKSEAPKKSVKKADKETAYHQKVDGQEIKLTNQHKIYWPREGFTKGDVIDYYNTMSSYILPYLKNRPESLNRYPNGIEGESFYQKDAGDAAPAWVTTTKVFSESNQKEIDYIVCNNKATLLYLANLGCIEMNPWNSTIQNQDQPSYMILDIDPSEKNNFEQVIETALAAKQVLDECGANSFCKTSGASGLHVFVPMGNQYKYEQVKNFAHLIAIKVVELLPDFTTIERNLKKRSTHKIYVDYLQNRRGQTIASAYSLRPRPGATASAPLDWKEVKKGLHPSKFDIKTLPVRVKKTGDIFSPVLGKGIDLDKCLKKMDNI